MTPTTTMNKNYILGGILVLLILIGIVYYANHVGTLQGVADATVVTKSGESSSVVSSSIVPAVTSKATSAHFKCDSNRIIDATYVFDKSPHVDLTLTDSLGIQKDVSLPQDLSSIKPQFASKDKSIVLLSKDDGSVGLQEKGIISFANCKAQ